MLSLFSAPLSHRFSVFQETEHRPCPLSKRLRLWLAASGVVLLVLLAIAGRLRPDPRGWGTHEQLGLRPCTFLILFGKPCPSCGMTTAWAHLVQGHVVSAFRVHASGALLGIVAVAWSVWSLASAASGRWFLLRPKQSVLFGLAIGLLMLVLIDWQARLVWHSGSGPQQQRPRIDFKE